MTPTTPNPDKQETPQSKLLAGIEALNANPCPDKQDWVDLLLDNVDLIESSLRELTTAKAELAKKDVIAAMLDDLIKAQAETITEKEAELTGARKDVERLREALNQCRCAIYGWRDTNEYSETCVLNLAYLKAKEVLDSVALTPKGNKE